MRHQLPLYFVHVCRRTVIKMAGQAEFSMLAKRRPVIGVCQLTCTEDKDRNFLKSKALIERCKNMGAQVCFILVYFSVYSRIKNGGGEFNSKLIKFRNVWHLAFFV